MENNQLNLDDITIGSLEFNQLDEFLQLRMVKESDNEELLCEVVLGNSNKTSLCYAAIQNINDEEKLYDIAMTHSNILVARAAIERIHDSKKLKDIYSRYIEDGARYDWQNRYVAVWNISDEEKDFLRHVKNEDPSYEIFKLARAKLNFES